jgi:large subunit ribosomal protein L21
MQVQPLQPMQSVVPIQNPETAQSGSFGVSSMAIAAAVLGTVVGRWWAKEQTEKSRAQVARLATLAVGGQAAVESKINYAVVDASGRQYMIEEGRFYDFDNMKYMESGDRFTLNRVLLVVEKDAEEPNVGRPYLEDWKVEATVLRHLKGPKIRVFKYRPKKGTRRTKGFRAQKTRILIDSITKA